MTLTALQMRQGVSSEISRLITGTTTNDGNAGGTTFLDSLLAVYPDDDFRTKDIWALATSGTYDGQERPTSDFTSSTGTVTTATAFGGKIVAAVTYEIHPFRPSRIMTKLNEAIKRTRYLFRVITDESVSTRSNQYSYPVPSSIIGDPREIWISSANFSNTIIHACDVAWDELVDGDATVTLDDIDYQEGTASNKFTIAAGMSAADIIATDSISALDLSDAIGVEFDIKCSVAASAGALQLLLDEHASCASPSETLSAPALTADVWQHVTVLFTGATTTRDAIISVGLKYTTDLGACTVWIDNIKAIDTLPQETVANMEDWTKLWFWLYDATNSKVRFPYALPEGRKLRMIGPGYLTTLSTTLTTTASTASTTETSEPDARHLYAMALESLFNDIVALSSESIAAQAKEKRDEWAARAEYYGRQIKLNLPPPTFKKYGWTYYGRLWGG